MADISEIEPLNADQFVCYCKGEKTVYKEKTWKPHTKSKRHENFVGGQCSKPRAPGNLYFKDVV